MSDSQAEQTSETNVWHSATNMDVAAIALWEALDALLTECDNDVLFPKCAAQDEARAVLAQTTKAALEAKERVRKQRSLG